MSESSHTGEWMVAYPESLDDLIESSDLIVEGTVLSAEYLGLSRGYDANNVLQFGTPVPGTRGSRAIPLSQHVIGISQIYLDSTSQLEPGDEIVIRQVGEYRPDFDTCDDYERDQPEAFGAPGQHYLYFLKEEPDGLAYSLSKGDGARLDVFGPQVRDSSCDQGIVLFAPTDPAEFMAALQDALASP